jgi:hypothetical protein
MCWKMSEVNIDEQEQTTNKKEKLLLSTIDDSSHDFVYEFNTSSRLVILFFSLVFFCSYLFLTRVSLMKIK